VPANDPVFTEAERGVKEHTNRLLSINGTRTVNDFHRELGKIMIENCGMSRSEPGLTKALSEIPALKEEFQKDVKVLGDGESLNESLENAARLEDFFELAELMCRDALERNESCGGHFRVESQTEEGEALRNDEDYSYVSAWSWNGPDKEQTEVREPLSFEYVKLAQRSYK
jgi:succinate dehydrogenase / fumarate reductase flavoprotein subunit